MELPSSDAAAPPSWQLEQGEARLVVDAFGATIRSWVVPVPGEAPRDIVLGFASDEAYRDNPVFMGCAVGPYANRIAGARLSVAGADGGMVRWTFERNDGPHHLHGGKAGFHRARWRGTQSTPNQLLLRYEHPDGWGGYPGPIDVSLRVVLAATGSVTLTWQGVSPQRTLFNPTQHTYFNLDGDSPHPSILNHRLQLHTAAVHLPGDTLIPSVDPTPLEDSIFSAFGAGCTLSAFYHANPTSRLDHHFAGSPGRGNPRPLASLSSSDGKVHLDVDADTQGLQVFGGHWGALSFAGRATNQHLTDRAGICLETQDLPSGMQHDPSSDSWLHAHRPKITTTRYTIRTNP